MRFHRAAKSSWDLSWRCAIVVASLFSLGLQAPTRTARIEFEIGMEPGATPTAASDWQRLLTELHVDDLRMRTVRADDKPAIETSGTDAARRYQVIGILTRGNELILPGGKYHSSDRARLATWLDVLRREGPERAGGAPRLPFDLSREQLAEIRQDLSQPVGFSTRDMPLSDFLHKVAGKLAHPVEGEPSTAGPTRAARPIGVELREMSIGTALAYVLHDGGLAMTPKLDAQKKVQYTVVPFQLRQERWPLGWTTRQRREQMFPALYEIVDAQIENVELSAALDTIAERTKTTILVDRPALTREKIDLDVKVSLPPKKMMYEMMLSKLLIPKLLRYEIRTDEAGRPFVWVTTARYDAGDKEQGVSR